MNNIKLKPLQGQLRLKIIELYYKANAGHIGCSLSCIDILIGSLIVNRTINDDCILSKGHAAVSLYVALNYLGEISNEQLNTFYKNGTRLPAHPAHSSFPSIPLATGSLGHGLPVATGIAKANKLKNTNAWTYVIMSDGETNEGTTWEAAHFAVRHKLNNLIVLIDKNKIQGFGNTMDIMGDSASKEKWEALGFECEEIDGHNLQDLIKAIHKMKNKQNLKPCLIIANTIKGKGISYMENKMEWHYLPMTEEQYIVAQDEIIKTYLS
jgi:transketolase